MCDNCKGHDEESKVKALPWKSRVYMCVYHQVIWLEDHVLVKHSNIVNMVYMCMIRIKESIDDYVKQEEHGARST